MNMQRDLFTPDAEAVEIDGIENCPVASVTKTFDPIAVPCGFIDRANHRCKRLGSRPVLIDGHQMVSRGRPMVHCDPTCFSVALELQAQEEDAR